MSWFSGWSLSRRDALRAGSLAGTAALSVPLLANCGTDTPPPPDPLRDLAAVARDNATMAETASTEHRDLADAGKMIATHRRRHAEALDAEIARMRPSSEDQPQPPVPAPTAPVTAADSGQAHRDLVEALRDAQAQASALVATLPPYRAGLVGSIAASCACLPEVLR